MGKVSVLIYVPAGALHLRTAIDSLLVQEEEDFSLLLLDDASGENLTELVASLGDPRVRIIRNAVPLGPSLSLNAGLKACSGAYVTVMGCDDIALPERLGRQVRYLESNPDIGIVGSDSVLIDARHIPIRRTTRPAADLALRWRGLWSSPFVQGSVMIRADILRAHGILFDPAYDRAGDLHLWHKVLSVSRGANLSDALMQRRWHHEALDVRERPFRQAQCHAILCRALNGFAGGDLFVPEDVALIRQCLEGPLVAERAAVRMAMHKLVFVFRAFARFHRTDPDLRSFVSQERRFMAARLYKTFGALGPSLLLRPPARLSFFSGESRTDGDMALKARSLSS